MSSDVGLTSALRSNLASLQNAKGSSGHSRAREAGGTSSQPSPHASSTISNQTLSTHANELQGVLDGISSSVKILEAASNAAAKLSTLLNETEQFVSNVLTQFKQAENNTPENYKILNQNIAEVLNRIDEIVGEGAYKGKNLLTGHTLETSFNAGRPLVTTGLDVSTKGLSLPPPPVTSISAVENFASSIAAAQIDIAELQQFVNEDLSLTQTRRDFTQESISTLVDSGDLNIFDQDEEAVNLLALKTRQALSGSDISLAGENQKSIFKLF
ncbi:MAG: hypothetical protein ACRBCT_08745 [Alphaproteobacteria bacterium]